jgi:hypothetical protein
MSIILILLIVLASGIGSALAQENDDEWVLVEGTYTSLEAPATWFNPLSYPSFEEAIVAAEADNPALATAVDSYRQSALSTDFDLILIDPVSSSNVAVIASDLGEEVALEDLADLLGNQFKTMGAEVVESEFLKLPAGEAFLIHVKQPFSGVTVEQLQYWLISGRTGYTITLSTAEENFPDYEVVFGQMVDSFSIITVGEVETRQDVKVIEAAGIQLHVPESWFSVRDQREIEAYLQGGGATHAYFQGIVDTLTASVQGGTYQLGLVDATSNAFIIVIATEIGADLDPAIFEESVVNAVKGDSDNQFIGSEFVALPSGKALRVELLRPIMYEILYHEFRYVLVVNQTQYIIILDVDETLYADYHQTFDDIMNSLTFEE